MIFWKNMRIKFMVVAGVGLLLPFTSSVTAYAGQKKNSPSVQQLPESTADHSKFKVLDQNFTSGSDVTKACLSCHNEAGKQVQHTFHWTWQSKSGLQKGIGKKNVLNNF